MAQSESGDEGDEDDDAIAAATAGSSRRPSRRAAAEAVQKLRAQSAASRRRRSRNLSEERKEASVDSDASEDEDGGPARATARSILRDNKQRGAFAVVASLAASNRTHHSRQPHTREISQRDEDESEQSEDGSSSGSNAVEESDSGSALSELSDEEEDENMTACADELLNEYAFDDADDGGADEWKPGAAAPSSSTRRRKRGRLMPSLLHISPLNAVRRFIVEGMDSQNSSSYVGPRILQAVIDALDVRKSVTHHTTIRLYQFASGTERRLAPFSCCCCLFQSGPCAQRAV